MRNLVDIVRWEVGDEPEAEQIENAIAIGGRYPWYYIDGSDMINLAFFRFPVVDEEKAEKDCAEYFRYISGSEVT